jgi:hypothetical protein
MGPMRCPETSINNYHTTPRNIPEERRSSFIIFDFVEIGISFIYFTPISYILISEGHRVSCLLLQAQCANFSYKAVALYKGIMNVYVDALSQTCLQVKSSFRFAIQRPAVYKKTAVQQVLFIVFNMYQIPKVQTCNSKCLKNILCGWNLNVI